MKAQFFIIAAGGALLSGIIAHHQHISVRGNLVAICDQLRRSKAVGQTAQPITQHLVAHAGGAVQNHLYTNSRESLDEHYRDGYRVFELDFAWTADGHLVLTHDWATTSVQFCVEPHRFSYAEFIARKRCDGLKQMTFCDLRQWMLQHRDALIVTDTKDSNNRLFPALRDSGPDVLPQLVLQIYSLSELAPARELHPRAVWMTVYKHSYPAWALRNVRGVDAIVIPISEYRRYRDDHLMRILPWYVHSVSHEEVDDVLRDLQGVYGAFVD